MLPIEVHFLPPFDRPEVPAQQTAVVIDVLRASTTICTALQNGARAVLAVPSVEAARGMKSELGDAARLGGERGGVRVEGFDFGNSPAEYHADAVAGRDVVFTTTNGTRALSACTQAAAVLTASFVSMDAVVREVSRLQLPVHLVCAGTDGAVTAEDVLFAGMLASELSRTQLFTMRDSARVAAEFCSTRIGPEASDVRSQLIQALEQSQGGRNLLALDYGADLALAADLNAVGVCGRLTDGTRIVACAGDSR